MSKRASFGIQNGLECCLVLYIPHDMVVIPAGRLREHLFPKSKETSNRETWIELKGDKRVEDIISLVSAETREDFSLVN
jgi:hypothetical protein